MVSYVETLDGSKSAIGPILDIVTEYYDGLFFNKRKYTRVVFYDLKNKIIVRNAYLDPNDVATVKRCRLPISYKYLLQNYTNMIGGTILKSLSKLKAEYNYNSTQAEFLLLAFYIVNGDQEAMSAHQIWRDQMFNIKKDLINKNDINAEIDLNNLKRDQLPYLSDGDINALKSDGFFIELNRCTFKIDKRKFYSEIFINKHVAYQQLVNTFKDVTIQIGDNSYKVCNIVDREKTVNEYWDSIGCLADRHAKVIEACEYAIENNLVNNGLIKIIANEEYNDWIKLLNETCNDNSDTDPNDLLSGESTINIVY